VTGTEIELVQALYCWHLHIFVCLQQYATTLRLALLGGGTREKYNLDGFIKDFFQTFLRFRRAFNILNCSNLAGKSITLEK